MAVNNWTERKETSFIYTKKPSLRCMMYVYYTKRNKHERVRLILHIKLTKSRMKHLINLINCLRIVQHGDVRSIHAFYRFHIWLNIAIAKSERKTHGYSLFYCENVLFFFFFVVVIVFTLILSSFSNFTELRRNWSCQAERIFHNIFSVLSLTWINVNPFRFKCIGSFFSLLQFCCCCFCRVFA